MKTNNFFNVLDINYHKNIITHFLIESLFNIIKEFLCILNLL